jgi:hypothetical protein
MTKPPLEDRIVNIHGVKQFYEVNEYPCVTRVHGTLSNAKHLGSNLKVLSIHPLSLEANFLFFRKYHLNHAGARHSYYKICVHVTFTTIIFMSRPNVSKIDTHVGTCEYSEYDTYLG